MCAVQGQRQQKPPELGKVPCGRICKTLNFRQHINTPPPGSWTEQRGSYSRI
nr:MAG TPA_asm: hypothetical protein [Caudoviricetes sp.]